MQTKAIILGAGMGTRMHSPIPKVLHKICGKPMVNVLINTLEEAGIKDIIVVVGSNMDAVKQTVAPYKTVEQTERLGTAHAVLQAKDDIQPFDGTLLVLYGDSPLVKPETIKKIVQKCEDGTDVVVMGFLPQDTRRYGRLLMGADGLECIIEYKDATDEQRAIKLCNSSVMAINGKYALELLKEVKNDNVGGEYYLTEVVKIAKEKGLSRDVIICDVEEAHGVNTPEELATAELILKKRNGEV